jgi:ketol-acid reductoisomerase
MAKAKIYYDSDADLALLHGKRIAIIGYGNQGSAQALNMRDSGVMDIIVGSRDDESAAQARADNFEVLPIKKAVASADIIFLLLPDEVAPEIYKKDIEPGLKAGKILNFASAYNITFKKIIPPPDVDVIMAAPRMIGKGVRELYQCGDGFPAFVGVAQDASGKALEYAKALCKAIGSTKKGAIEVKFEDETFLDLMTEQATWPIIYNVFNEVFKLEIAMGHPEEAVLMEMYVSKEPAVMMDKAADVGLFKQLPYHSHTSQFGQMLGYDAFNKQIIRDFVKERYDRIKNGIFTKEWDKEQNVNHLAKLKAMEEKAFNGELSKAEEDLHKALE